MKTVGSAFVRFWQRLLALVELLMQLERPSKQAIILVADIALCAIATLLAFSLRVGAFSFPVGPSLLFMGVAIPAFAVTFHIFGVYATIFRFSGARTIFQLARAALVYTFPVAAVFLIWGVPGIPRTLGLLQPMIFVGLVGISRIFVRYLLLEVILPKKFGGLISRVLIYGAGSAGQQLAASLRHKPGFVLGGFVDDDQTMRGKKIDGRKIYRRDDLEGVLGSLGIDTVVMALPGSSRARRRQIVESLQGLHVHVRTLPDIGEIAGGKVSVSDLREVEIDDLLGRDQVAPNEILLAKSIVGKTVLVTGAGGSIGAELCRQILAIGARRLILFDISEYALYQINEELLKAAENTRPGLVEIVPVLGSVLDRECLNGLFKQWRPDTVFHAAAYKHVPLVEANPLVGMRNNVLGTNALASVAAAFRVRDFTLVSTDKAVRPTNIMGASKRCAEIVVQGFAANSPDTRFSIVRFGNVLGSSGSVVPLFRQQIEAGGPITLTHCDITRYFMTIPEAAQLVIQAGGMARGGEVFVLDMGQPIRIIELARSMIKLSGLSLRDDENPDGEIEIVEVGLRPGEKLYEELLIGENPEETDHPRIMKAHERSIGWMQLQRVISERNTCQHVDDVIYIFQQVEPDFQHRRDNQAVAKVASA